MIPPFPHVLREERRGEKGWGEKQNVKEKKKKKKKETKGGRGSKRVGIRNQGGGEQIGEGEEIRRERRSGGERGRYF